MLNLDLERVDAFVTPSPTPAGEGVLALVGLAGEWVGTGIILVSEALACEISSRFLMAEYLSLDEEVLDVLAEVTNITLGNVKTRLEDQLGPMGMSIPTVIHGQNFGSRTFGKQEWTVVPFRIRDEKMEIRMCLAPHRERTMSPTNLTGHATTTKF
jgi:CheY-specific phosphatase CheX